MIMKKTTKAFLLLSLLHLLLCLSSLVRLTEATLPGKAPILVHPSPPCRGPLGPAGGASLSSLGSRNLGKPCVTIPRPPKDQYSPSKP